MLGANGAAGATAAEGFVPACDADSHVWGKARRYQADYGEGVRWYLESTCLKCPAERLDDEERTGGYNRDSERLAP